MGELAQAVKDRILIDTFSLPIFIGLARSSERGLQEETDAAYTRMPVKFTGPQGQGLRYIANAELIMFPAYAADAEPIQFGLLSHDQAGGDIIWTERLDREVTLPRGGRMIFEPGEIRVGLP